MDTTLELGLIPGSLRAESVTRRLAHVLAGLTPSLFHGRVLEIGDLPLYNEDLDVGMTTTPPAPWTRFRNEVRRCDAVLFVTPEYNRSVPAPLKNAVDVGSAPHGQGAFTGTPAAIISASPGRMGAFGANHHLRQSLVFLDMPTMAQPELYLGDSDRLFDPAGRLRHEDMRDRLVAYLTAFSAWCHRQIRVPA
ncbi:NADPH-dependent FMN reductase [Nakamurella sp.]|uniref:NADPH-dependent FMN reductase n=1 Tax=Nakamurella sp. TaxID=1869182 RepID=UPI003B3AE5C2